jgi:flagellar basal-body rod modification protein FlgD
MDGIDKNLPTFESLGLGKTKDKLNEKPRLGQEDFMKLMMTQMNHQDPMKPMEHNQFISQMAQFSAVSGLKEIKDSFGTLASALQSSQALQASSMVGRQVLIPGDRTTLPEGGALRGAIEVPAETDSLTLKIRDGAGQLVHTLDLGEQRQGTRTFEWDGVIKQADEAVPGSTEQRAEPGLYSITAEMMVDGEPQAVNTLVVDKVSSVSLSKDQRGVTLNLDHSGSTSLAEVKEIM